MKRLGIVAAVLLATAVPAAAQLRTQAILTWSPERPVQGTLFRVRVESPGRALVAATGQAAGEPLHFEPTVDGALVAFAAAPLDAGDKTSVNVAVVHADGRVDTLAVDVPVAAGSYALERLTVAPRFGAPPDSATQARIDRERARAAAVSAAAHETPRLWREVVPPRDSRITSGFGSGREFNGRVQSRHTGTDFQGNIGAPVHAAARGIVAWADTLLLAGRAVYVDHGAGLVTAYFHLSETGVAEGDTVQAGQRIGAVGATGRVTGPHLHWVVRYGRISVDPMRFLDLLTTENR